jgi:TPR repeat protein
MLLNGIGVPIDLEGAAHYLQLSADQGSAGGQNAYGIVVRDSRSALRALFRDS